MRRRRLVTTLALAVSLLAGCGDETPRAQDQQTAQDDQAQDDVRVVAEDEAQLHLWVSNQSFADDPIRITVTIDGVEVVDEEFEVEGQHNWLVFPIALPPGKHELEVTSGTGASLVKTFRTEEGASRYAVLNYWNYEDDDGRYLEWMIQEEPPVFG